PVIHSKDDVFDGVDFVTGARGQTDLDRVVKFLRSLYDPQVVGLDYETNALRPYNPESKILTIALSSKRETLAFPLEHSGSGWSKENLITVLDEYEKFLYEAKCRKIAHHL